MTSKLISVYPIEVLLGLLWHLLSFPSLISSVWRGVLEISPQLEILSNYNI